jgi:hypothetical protein
MAIVLGHLLKEGPLVPANLFASVGLAAALVPRVTAASVPHYYCKLVQFVLNTTVPNLYSRTARIAYLRQLERESVLASVILEIQIIAVQRLMVRRSHVSNDEEYSVMILVRCWVSIICG